MSWYFSNTWTQSVCWRKIALFCNAEGQIGATQKVNVNLLHCYLLSQLPTNIKAYLFISSAYLSTYFSTLPNGLI